MKLYLIVANDGDSWHSLLEQDVWDAVELWADGYYDIFKIHCRAYSNEPHATPFRLIRAEEGTAYKDRELVWEEVKSAEELKSNASRTDDETDE